MILVKMKAISKPEISQSTEESTALQSSETADHTEADASICFTGKEPGRVEVEVGLAAGTPQAGPAPDL